MSISTKFYLCPVLLFLEAICWIQPNCLFVLSISNEAPYSGAGRAKIWHTATLLSWCGGRYCQFVTVSSFPRSGSISESLASASGHYYELRVGIQLDACLSTPG